eukprot:GDKJ01022033.1.p1 GENE.GDKJ01022033.1~~GDKJ01022033.1.p1  ORF type:complete len:295 (-),score=35.78 GDKJ01022033.1:225-1109(-)
MIYFPAADSKDLNLDSVGRYLCRVRTLSSLHWTDVGAQLINLLLFPERVYQQAVHRKQIKQRFSREDPALVLSILLFVLLSSMAYCIAYASPLWRFLSTPVFLSASSLLVIVCWAHLISRWVNKKLSEHSQVVLDDAWGDDDSIVQAPTVVEGLYCLDIAANCVWVFWFYSVIVPFFFLPVSLNFKSVSGVPVPTNDVPDRSKSDSIVSSHSSGISFEASTSFLSIFLPLSFFALGIYLSGNVFMSGMQLIPKLEDYGAEGGKKWLAMGLIMFVFLGVMSGFNLTFWGGLLMFS